MNKREFLKLGLVSSAIGMSPTLVANAAKPKLDDLGIVDKNGHYILPALPYAYDALEPYIDAETMRIHHDIHHKGYVTNLNKAVEGSKEAIRTGDYKLVSYWENQLTFNGAGHFLHSLFWITMGPKAGNRSRRLNRYIEKDFGSFSKFKDYFNACAGAVQGSGWGILAYQPEGDRLVILQAEKHQNLSQWISVPILVVDVWEHSYYLKYQNKRGNYLDAFFKVIDWTAVSDRLYAVMRST